MLAGMSTPVEVSPPARQHQTRSIGEAAQLRWLQYTLPCPRAVRLALIYRAVGGQLQQVTGPCALPGMLLPVCSKALFV